jgi:hypothetical protein
MISMTITDMAGRNRLGIPLRHFGRDPARQAAYHRVELFVRR